MVVLPAWAPRGDVVSERSSMRKGFVDSRCSSRYEAVRTFVYLGWWEEPEFVTVAAVLRNLSHGGALIHIGVSPPEERGLWLCLAGAPPSEWVEVSSVGIRTLNEGLYELRLRFPESCPYEIFNAAVLGLDSGEMDAVAAPVLGSTEPK